MTKTTLGPWKTDENGIVTGGPDFCTSICETPVILWYTAGGKAEQQEQIEIARANARLIAASPTMLTLCKGALAALSQNKTFPGDIDVAKAFLADAIAAAETL